MLSFRKWVREAGEILIPGRPTKPIPICLRRRHARQLQQSSPGQLIPIISAKRFTSLFRRLI
jgi:hypothetical protein